MDRHKTPTRGHVSVSPPTKLRFELHGSVEPIRMAKAVQVGGVDYVPSRPLGGWLATYGKIAPDGSIVETRDRQGHVFEAARAVGQIDFSAYLKKGLWDDTHQKVFVGRPTLLEHHDGTTELSKAHRKVGWWTEGHLFDRNDPRSWSLFTSYEPTAKDLERSDYFWTLATMLKGGARPLGFSAEGDMLLSPCKSRIIMAWVKHNAVCEMPQNPDSTAIPLRLSTDDRIDLDMLGAKPCDTCRCPPGARCSTLPTLQAAKLAKAMADAGPVTTDPTAEGDTQDEEASDDGKKDLGPTAERLIELLCKNHQVTPATARRWVVRYIAQEQARRRAQETTCP